MTLKIWRVTHMDLAKQFSVIRHHRKVQRTIETYRAHGQSVFIPGLYPERLTLCEAVRLRRCGQCALSARIQGIAGMHVKVTKEWLPVFVMKPTGMTLFRVFLSGTATERQCEQVPAKQSRGNNASRLGHNSLPEVDP